MGHLSNGAPWDTLAFDYFLPLPLTENDNRYIMVLKDHFTIYFTDHVEVIPVPSQQADVCALKIANGFVARWACPLSIHSDLGATFDGSILKKLCKLFDIRNTGTKHRHPRSNG